MSQQKEKRRVSSRRFKPFTPAEARLLAGATERFFACDDTLLFSFCCDINRSSLGAILQRSASHAARTASAPPKGLNQQPLSRRKQGKLRSPIRGGFGCRRR